MTRRFRENGCGLVVQYVVLKVYVKKYGVWLSLARAPGLGPGGRRFESCHPDSNICASGSVVEYRLAKARVAGSNPVSRSFYLTQESCNSKVSCVFCIEGGDLCTGRAGYRLDSQMSAINI